MNNLRSQHARRTAIAGFTLMELMVVISIIVVLMGLTLMGARTVDTTARRNRAQSEVAALSTALENYKIDNGTYPVPASGSMPNATTAGDPISYITSAELLFTALSGRANFDTEPVAGVKSYYPFKKNNVKAGPTSPVVDPWGNAYGYNSVDPAYNVGFFDLWTTCGANELTKKSQWIGNFKTD
ncbi:hypothetical protein DB346_22065 [Verrucomicrobia bacterium LW23]|nr:hypothetical protein DB346_22065 [Verrucomicrobia bacterium LW23]